MKKVLLTLALAAFAFAANAQFVVSGQLGFSTNGGKTSETTTLGTTTENSTMPADVNTNIYFRPSIGYMLNEKMQIGLGLGLNYNYEKTYNTVWNVVTNVDPATSPLGRIGQAYGPYTDKAEDWVTKSSFDFTIAPYFRYYLMEAGNFNFFCEASVALTFNGRPHYHLFATKIDADPTHLVAGTARAFDTTYVGDWGGVAVANTNSESWTKSGSIAVNIVPGVNYKFNERISADLYLDLLNVNFTHRWSNESYDRSTTATTNTGKTNTSSNSFNFGANFNSLSLNRFLAFRLGFNYHF